MNLKKIISYGKNIARVSALAAAVYFSPISQEANAQKNISKSNIQVQFGGPGFEPVIGDYDGDGTSDIALYHEQSGNWYIGSLSKMQIISWANYWGANGLKPVAGDFDGDGKADLAVYDQKTGDWYIKSLDERILSWQENFGYNGAVPVSGDFDGDGISDKAVYDQNNGNWYFSKSKDNYQVTEFINGDITEKRLYLGDRHFMTVLLDGGAFVLRPHPGVEPDGWGTSPYIQPFLPGAELNHTTLESVVANPSNVSVCANGYVSKGGNETFGTWNLNIVISYNKNAKKITGNGTYTINLTDLLSTTGLDLNLLKIASNYLNDVPLLGGGIGDTGDMQHAHAIGQNFDTIWIPPNQPSHFPQDETDNLSVEVIGQYNNVDTAAQGYDPINPAHKPTVKLVLNSNQQNIKMIIGYYYDTTKSTQFWSDNVGITPLILKTSPYKQFSFNVDYESNALPGDGN